MGLERVHEILQVLAENFHQSGYEVDAILHKVKNERSGTRGPNSEAFAKFIISLIPEVTGIEEIHEHINNLDCDMRVSFINSDPVHVQVKSSTYGVFVFTTEMNKVLPKTKKPLRWVVVNLEDPFDKIQKDFVDQVNKLDGRKSLTLIGY